MRPLSWWPGDAAHERQEASRRLDVAQLAAFARVKAIVLDCDGILTDGALIYGPQGEALKTFHARDGLGLVLARSVGLKLVLITGRNSAIAARRASELRFDVVLVGRFDKGQALSEILSELDLSAADILYMGDDLIDLPALDAAGLAVTVPEAPSVVRACCRYVTATAGGAGAVREVTDLVLMSRGELGEALSKLAAEAAGTGEETS